ncbi:hypothetical protein LCGC14_0736390 [marine sediment metagenome]|uniref:RNA polymerase sigma-70 region 2 domain-containing protein n=1 Tax=marine sediment metagenome TaxID=412755 RepID=A0A0F9SSW7_9ZZZZ
MLEWITGIAKHVASRYHVQDYRDLIGAGWIGYDRAQRRFDPGRGVKFITFAFPRIRGAMLDQLRAERGARRAGFEQRSQLQHLAEDGLWVRAPSCSPAIDAEDHVQFALRMLPGRDRIVLRRLSRGETQREVGASLGVTESRVCQLRKRALDRARRHAVT